MRLKKVILVLTSSPLRDIVKSLNRIRLEYSILSPSQFKDIACSQDIIILTEKEIASSVNKLVGGKCKLVVIDRDMSIESIIARIFRESKGKVFETLIGIDPGVLLTFVVIADGLLLHYGKESRVQDLKKKLKNLLNELVPQWCIIRIGSRGDLQAISRTAFLLNDVCKNNLLIELVDEKSSTSNRLLPYIIGLDARTDTDVKAAIRIAFRRGIPISFTLNS